MGVQPKAERWSNPFAEVKNEWHHKVLTINALYISCNARIRRPLAVKNGPPGVSRHTLAIRRMCRGRA